MKYDKVRRLAIAGVMVATTFAGAGSAAAAKSAPSEPRLVTITIPARHADIDPKWLPYDGLPRANVLLPAGDDPHKRYPLLVALHGVNCNYAWYAQTGLTHVFDGLQAIVVMPEGASGWYADWWNHGLRGKPSWETYELDDVLPTILKRYRILPQRRYHALMGISMGGLGAGYLGGRLPGFFGSVAPLSGFTDPQYYAPIPDAAMGVVSLAPLEGNLEVFPVFGRPYGFYLTGHNPTRMAVNMRQTRVFLSAGNGAPSQYAPYNHPGSEEEGVVIYPMTQDYHRALTTAGVDVTYQPHTGGHDILDFAAEMKAYLAWGPFKPVITNPETWTNDTVATHGQLWDIGYRFAKPPTEVVKFSRTMDKLSISDAGSAVTLTTDGGCAIHTPTPATVKIPRHCGR